MRGLIDTTLREGAQSVGVQFNHADKLQIVRLLTEIGIEEIELGLAADGDKLANLLMDCRQPGSKSRFALWCRCREDDIKKAAILRPDVLSLSIPASDLHLKQRLNRDRRWAIHNLHNSIIQARANKIPYISVGLEDASRADSLFLKTLAETATKAGANRIRLADTVGTNTPKQTEEMINRIKQVTHLDIAIHAHNDFGMASANAINALDAGANWADVSVLGLGERAGMAKLEEVAGFLALQRHRDYRTELLKTLCENISRITKRNVEPHHPVVGKSIFACETGLHLQGLLQEPKTYEPFEPKRVGGERQLLFGTKTGRKAIQGLLNNKRQLPASALKELTESIRKRAQLAQRPLTAEEIISAATP